MDTTPPILLPERIDALLSRAAELCMAALEEAGERLKTAEDAEAFERSGRTFNGICRSLRQVIAMKQRFDRDQIVIDKDRRCAEVEAEKEAAAERALAGAEMQGRLRRHFGRVLWEVYDDEEDAQEVYEAFDDLLGELVEAEDFLDLSYETLVERLTEQFCPDPDDEADGGHDTCPPTRAAAPEPAAARGQVSCPQPPPDG